MKTFAVLAVFLSLGLLCAAYDPIPYLRTLERDDFGKKVLDIIQIQMNTADDPVNNALDILSKMREDILASRRSTVQVHQAMAVECGQAVPQIDQEILNYNAKKLAAQNDLEAKLIEKGGLTKQSEEHQAVYDAVLKAIEELKNQRAADKKAYEEAGADFGKLREALKQAKDILSKVEVDAEPAPAAPADGAAGTPPADGTAGTPPATTFAEIAPSVLVQIRNIVGSSPIKHPQARAVRSLAHSLIEMALRSKADKQKLLEKIFAVIDRILERLGDSEFRATLAEAARKKVFEAQLLEQQKLEFASSQTLSQIKVALLTLNAGILQIENDLNHFDTSIEQKDKEKQDRIDGCKTENADHATKLQSLTDQLGVIEEIIRLLQQNVVPVKQYIAGRSA
eukprot:TRINITY_DN0_c2188_g1_i5.p1 TRINITY_DN0_c2188_g1~~TRINITY_DN0_c2188_g1_i5.p1  ORF type:complete len:396 (-),score=145.72 TRINITY_DN0_c2188_g1_i5:89-1276(-)